MKRRFCFGYGVYMIIISLLLIFRTGAESSRAYKELEVYFVDSDMLRLVSVDFLCREKSIQKQAEAVVDELVCGRDYNRKITRMIPDIKSCMKVRVKKNTALVDISSESLDYFKDGRTAETLIIYQVVNSLTSIDGVDKVRFTVDGRSVKKFKGFIDIRETFIPDYYV